jgi:hypothetical protein
LENLKSYFNLENSELANLSNPSSQVISELHQNLENLERQLKETDAELASLIIDQSDNIRRYDELTEVRNSLTDTFLQVHAHFVQKLALLKVIVSANPFTFAGSTLLLGGALLGGAYLAYRSSSSSSLSSSSGTSTDTGGIVTVTEILNRPGPISLNLPNTPTIQPTVGELVTGSATVYAIRRYLKSCLKYIPKIILRRR